MHNDMHKAERTALIIGVTGAVGSALARELGPRKAWHVLGVSRREVATPVSGVDYLTVDVGDAYACREIFGAAAALTHVFYCARATHQEQVLEDASANVRLLKNVLDAVEARSANDLRHVHLVQGGKYYGVHVGPFPTPARENDTRAPIENFNYDQEDLLRARSVTANWSWSASRPNTLLHFSPDIARNLVSTLGVYAAICRETGAALDFPGPVGAYESITQVTSIDVLARAMAWMASEQTCANEAFNVTNSDVFRWKTLWPRIAEAFGMRVGSVRPLRLTDVMAGREDVWKRIAQRYGLQQSNIADVANWGFADATLERYWDEIMSNNKARAHGFHDWDDSEERFIALLEQYREAHILP